LKYMCLPIDWQLPRLYSEVCIQEHPHIRLCGFDERSMNK